MTRWKLPSLLSLPDARVGTGAAARRLGAAPVLDAFFDTLLGAFFEACFDAFFDTSLDAFFGAIFKPLLLCQSPVVDCW